MYTLKVLSEKEFDKLPYKHAKTSLGLANARTNVAFVRDTGYNDITKQTISHELDEMVSKHSPHEEDGIRYKNLGGMLGGAGTGILANMLPGKVGEMAKQFSPALSAGAGALINKDNPLQGAMQGFAGGGMGSSLGTGISQGIQGLTQPGGTFGKAMTGFGEGAKSGFNSYAGAIPGMGGYGTDNPTGILSKYFGGQGSGKTTAAPSTTSAPATISAGGGIDGGPGSSAAFAQQMANSPGIVPAVENATSGPSILQRLAKSDVAEQSAMEQFKGSLGKSAAGAGIGLIGDMFAPKVEVPDLAGYGADLQAKLASGELGDPIAKEAGMKELLRTLDQPMGEVPSSAFNLGDTKSSEAKVKALQNYTNHWKGIQPGVDYSQNPEFQRGYQEIEKQYDDERVMQRDQQQYQYDMAQLQQKYQYMMKALDVDQAQMSQYVQLAQLGIDQLMLEYGLSVGEAQQFKELFANMGQLAVQGGEQQQNPSVILNMQGGTA